jgi:hypothetical protein
LSALTVFPLVPLHARVLREQRLELRAEGRRSDGLRQDAQSRAIRFRGVERGLQRGDEVAPGDRVTEPAHDLRAVGIVEAEDRRLHDRVARAEARGMRRIALDLRRAVHVALDEHARRDAAERNRRGEEERFAGDGALRLIDVRNDLLGRRRACGEAGHRDRGAHQLQSRGGRRPCREERPAAELLVHEVVEDVAARQLFETAPVLLAAQVADAGAELGETQCL